MPVSRCGLEQLFEQGDSFLLKVNVFSMMQRVIKNDSCRDIEVQVPVSFEQGKHNTLCLGIV